jgi:transposase InsO family protein
MSWKECSVMDERLQFVSRRLAGEPMAELCREFGISRKTGYKIFDRDQECGVQGLTDRSRRPFRYANQLPFQVENYILNVKRAHTSWGARKIRERLIRRFSGIPIPSKRTIHAVLDRHGLVERRGRLRRRAQGTALSLGQRPNELWCTDYKSEFLLGNRQYCYPLTVTDHASRYLLVCEALSSTREDYAFTVIERLFKERGLPSNIRSDNGVPFASAHALFHLSKLAVWWLRLGIGIERIKPGHPRQNGRHERMHLTLKKETTKPAALNFLQQQARFDDFIEIFNQERPHEALAMKCPAEVYHPPPAPIGDCPIFAGVVTAGRYLDRQELDRLLSEAAGVFKQGRVRKRGEVASLRAAHSHRPDSGRMVGKQETTPMGGMDSVPPGHLSEVPAH